MSTALVMNQSLNLGSAIEKVLIGGDLAALQPEERVKYYHAVCASIGLNPLTKPFAYINLNGKLTLYALRDAADQLRKIHSVSVTDLSKEVIEGVMIVTAKGRDSSGREDTATGAVHIAGLKGENLANAMLKCETKAKRRLTLSICGLGMLDETEVADIPPSAKQAVDVSQEPRRELKPLPTAIESQPIRASDMQPGPNDGVVLDRGYMIDFGQWNKRSIEEVYNAFGPEKIASYIDFLESSAAKKGERPAPRAQKFIDEASTFLGAMENRPLEPEGDLPF